jgi:hypothetical protein
VRAGDRCAGRWISAEVRVGCFRTERGGGERCQQAEAIREESHRRSHQVGRRGHIFSLTRCIYQIKSISSSVPSRPRQCQWAELVRRGVTRKKTSNRKKGRIFSLTHLPKKLLVHILSLSTPARPQAGWCRHTGSEESHEKAIG